MASARHDVSALILAYLEQQQAVGIGECSPEAITSGTSSSRATVNRHLAKLLAEQLIEKRHSGPATRYALPVHAANIRTASAHAPFSAANHELITRLSAPIGSRQPVTYQRNFLDHYQPNQTSLLPPGLAQELFEQGRSRGQQPAGTYARKVLEQLLIDLSWHSSRLEGNRKSLLDTQELFARGHSDEPDVDTLMLLNHKEAIEFIVDAVPEYGMTVAVVQNVQAVLMQGLLINADALGQVRRRVVNISDSVYIPLQVPQLLEEQMSRIVDFARLIKNPIEAAFFLWIQLAYLQPFEDGNKRTSRLCANLPLLLQNCAPLSFLDVEQTDYALAILAVYEQQNPALAVELFAWTYRRSIAKYAVILEAMGAPDVFRQRYREHLGEAMRLVVVQGQPLSSAIEALPVPPQDLAPFAELVRQELTHLAVFNCARYRVALARAESWIAAGRLF